MSPIFGKNNLSSTESVDIIEKIVYEYLKPLGFRKHGRTLHRFVDTDISQVVNFQNGCPSKGVYDILWVNLGIRVPECVERKFSIEKPLKKYYHEYECNIRTRNFAARRTFVRRRVTANKAKALFALSLSILRIFS